MAYFLLHSLCFPGLRLYSIACYLDPDNTQGSWSVQGTAYTRGSAVEHACIDHGRMNVFVAERFLNGTNVVSILQ